mmetsp:Transcript_5748/g.10315  ORF Transcript_5748/g.10315 Transcript_5748/m.10315 type:complete len:214 (+) Transcript_5748:650-1291(+)
MSAQTDRVDVDETTSILWVVSLDRFHGRNVFIVQSGWRVPGDGHARALVTQYIDPPVDEFLCLVHGSKQKVHLWRVPESVVHELRELGAQHIAQTHDLTIHGNTLNIQMRGSQNSGTRSFIDAARLNTDKSVLDDIDTSNTVLLRDLIEQQEKRERLVRRLACSLVGHLDGFAIDKLDSHHLRFVLPLVTRQGLSVHSLGWRSSRVLQLARFV